MRAGLVAVRGVNSDGVVEKLLEKDLIKVVGRKDIAGKPYLYGTTKQFLEYFGLKSLLDLPRLEEFPRLEAAAREKAEAANQAAPAPTDKTFGTTGHKTADTVPVEAAPAAEVSESSVQETGEAESIPTINEHEQEDIAVTLADNDPNPEMYSRGALDVPNNEMFLSEINTHTHEDRDGNTEIITKQDK